MKFDFNEFLAKNRENAQLVYGVVLIILIPLLIAYNTIFIIKKYNNTLDVTLQRQALNVGRSIYTLIKPDLSDTAKLQTELESLKEKNSDFQEVSILVPDASSSNFRIMASSNKDNINKALQFYYYQFAWMQNDGEGLATDSMLLAKNDKGELMLEQIDPNQRYWLVALPMNDINGNKTAVLSMKISSRVVDELTNYNRNASIFLLVGTVFIVILFLLIAVRLWDYVLLYKKIKEVDQMKDEFISMASHELRTPVTGIRGYISMILDGTYGEINKDINESLSVVKGATERLATLVDDLLNVSRIEQGRIKIDIRIMNITQLISDIVKELKIQADEKKLELVFVPHAEILPNISVDPERLKQILINLIGNAVKYTEKGKVEILTEEKNSGKVLEIRIKDTGIGMSAKERERLFQKFYRVQNKKTREITGTGLGLWITKQLVEIMRGTIMVDSIENIGTQFTLQFPIVK